MRKFNCITSDIVNQMKEYIFKQSSPVQQTFFINWRHDAFDICAV